MATITRAEDMVKRLVLAGGGIMGTRMMGGVPSDQHVYRLLVTVIPDDAESRHYSDAILPALIKVCEDCGLFDALRKVGGEPEITAAEAMTELRQQSLLDRE